MLWKSRHIADPTLLQHADGELHWPAALRVRTHLAACLVCRSRLAQMQETLAAVMHLHRDAALPAAHIAGPRALLRARLATVAQPAASAPAHLRVARSLAYLTALALLTTGGIIMMHRLALRTPSTALALLPNPAITPGSTRQVNLTDICAVDRDEVVRSVPAPVQHQVFQEYGIKDQSATEFEVDYLITPGLGGSDDVRNLWPEPHFSAPWNSYVKDQLEDHLHRMVCERKLSLNQAQQDIATNWIAAYKKYFHTDQPLASPLRAALASAIQPRFTVRRKQSAL